MITREQVSEAAAAMARIGYRVRLEKYGIERIRQIARENGKLGGRPRRAEGKPPKKGAKHHGN